MDKLATLGKRFVLRSSNDRTVSVGELVDQGADSALLTYQVEHAA
ncbi:MAG: hypothetical protein ACRDMV_06375 [Streptosporangiales bacterium]